MLFVRCLTRTLLALLFAMFGTVAAFAAPGDWTQVSYAVEAQELSAQRVKLAYTARAPPPASANVMATDTAFAPTGSLRAFDDPETVGAVYALLRSSIAPKGGPRLITDAAGNTIDTTATKNLTSLSPSDVNFQAGRGATTYDMTAAPNSYANLGNGHAVVYGADGRALYDVSAGRVKVIEWNQNPNTGQWFPKTNSDLKAFEGNVPQPLLDDLGLN